MDKSISPEDYGYTDEWDEAPEDCECGADGWWKCVCGAYQMPDPYIWERDDYDTLEEYYE